MYKVFRIRGFITMIVVPGNFTCVSGAFATNVVSDLYKLLYLFAISGFLILLYFIDTGIDHRHNFPAR